VAEEQTSVSGGFSLGGTSLWKSAGEMRDDKLQKLAQAIPQLVKQVEVRCKYFKLYILKQGWQTFLKAYSKIVNNFRRNSFA
jgi:hypothetical protein